MDRRVKERLVGATILVVLIVLIVPELLSGPKRNSLPPLSQNLPVPTRNVSVDLATSKATPAPPADEPASAASTRAPGGDARGGDAPSGDARGGDAPGGAPPSGIPLDGAAHGADTPGTAAPPAESTLRAQEASPALETPPSSPKSPPGPLESARPQGHRAWAVQLGSFASKANADKLVHQLKASGSSVYVLSSGAGPSLRFRVRVGPLSDRDSAERAMLKLKSAGHAGTIVPPA
jgi:DedD protein